MLVSQRPQDSNRFIWHSSSMKRITSTVGDVALRLHSATMEDTLIPLNREQEKLHTGLLL